MNKGTKDRDRISVAVGHVQVGVLVTQKAMIHPGRMTKKQSKNKNPPQRLFAHPKILFCGRYWLFWSQTVHIF